MALDKDKKIVGMVIGSDGATFTLVTPIDALLSHPDWGNGPPLEICAAVPSTAKAPSAVTFPNRASVPQITRAVVAPSSAIEDFPTLLRHVMDQLGMASRSLRAGTAAICFGESGFRPRREDSYANTSSARIRLIFGSRVASMTDAQINELKVNDEEFFDLVYGGDFGRTQLGNTEPGDGFRFVGRGPIQLTGRSNYAKYGFLIGVDLTKVPDLVNEPETGCKVAVAYMRDRYHGGGFEAMKQACGSAVGTNEVEKNEAFAKFMTSGSFGGTEA
jgi:predicted chitinase